jgi:hypothetical protein
MEYDDGRIRCDERGLVIRWYGLFGAKKVPYGRIRVATAEDMSAVGGGSGSWGVRTFGTGTTWTLPGRTRRSPLCWSLGDGFGR